MALVSRRRLSLAVVVAGSGLLSASCGATSARTTGSTTVGSRLTVTASQTKPPPPTELERNKAAAAADAKHLVALVSLPTGSVKSATEPKGDHGLLKPMGVLETVLTHRLAHAWYIVPAGAQDPTSYVKEHPPGGVKNDGTMGPGGPPPGSFTLMYDFPDKPRVFSRMLEVTFTTLTDGDTGVLVAAQSNWIIPRRSSEKVPAGASKVLIKTVTSTKRSATGAAYPSITTKRKVRRLIKIVDAPPIAQNVVSSGCPESGGKQHTVTITFANANGKTLAKATANWTGTETVGDWCNPIGFKLGKKSQPALVDTHFLAQVEKVTGLKLRRAGGKSRAMTVSPGSSRSH